MAEIGKAHDLSAIQAALAATLMHPAIQVAIVGIKKTEHIEEAIGAASKQLARDVFYRLRAAIDG
jgi:aryl-alcohol dehydrogenase-like predicted oxidoreductase